MRILRIGLLFWLLFDGCRSAAPAVPSVECRVVAFKTTMTSGYGRTQYYFIALDGASLKVEQGVFVSTPIGICWPGNWTSAK